MATTISQWEKPEGLTEPAASSSGAQNDWREYTWGGRVFYQKYGHPSQWEKPDGWTVPAACSVSQASEKPDGGTEPAASSVSQASKRHLRIRFGKDKITEIPVDADSTVDQALVAVQYWYTTEFAEFGHNPFDDTHIIGALAIYTDGCVLGRDDHISDAVMKDDILKPIFKSEMAGKAQDKMAGADKGKGKMDIVAIAEAVAEEVDDLPLPADDIAPAPAPAAPVWRLGILFPSLTPVSLSARQHTS